MNGRGGSMINQSQTEERNDLWGSRTKQIECKTHDMPIKEEDVIIGAHQLQPNTHTFLYKHALFYLCLTKLNEQVPIVYFYPTNTNIYV